MSSTSRRQHSLLLTRDLRFAGRDLRLDGPESAAELDVEQLTLPGLSAPARRNPRRQSRPKLERQPPPRVDDPLLTVFRRRLVAQGRARKGQTAYQYQMRSILLIASRLAGRSVTCAD